MVLSLWGSVQLLDPSASPCFTSSLSVQLLLSNLAVKDDYSHTRTGAHRRQHLHRSTRGVFDRRRLGAGSHSSCFLTRSPVIHFVCLDFSLVEFMLFLFFLFFEFPIWMKSHHESEGCMLPTHLCTIVAFSLMSSSVMLMSTYYYNSNYVITVTISHTKWWHLLEYQLFWLELFHRIHPVPLSCVPHIGTF